MAATVTPFLMFQGAAEEALRLYASAFPDAEVLDLARYGPGEPGAEGSLKLATLRVGGQTLRIFASPDPHAFAFTPSFSLFVDCADEAELDRLADALSAGGEWLMPLGEYGFSRRFGWLNDRFGVSWQLNLP